MSKMSRNGVITQGLIGEHMVRVVSVVKGKAVFMYHAVIGLNWKKGNTRLNNKYREFTCQPEFPTATKAWEYGVNIARGATSNARND